MTSKTFIAGTVIDSAWLNDINTGVYTTLPLKVSANSPTLITPVLGVATATSINKITFTQPATGATLTIPDGLTATVSGTNTGDQNLAPYALLAGGTFTGPVTFSGLLYTKTQYFTVVALGNIITTATVDLTTGSTFTGTVTGNVVISFTGAPPAGKDQTVYLKLTNGGAFTTTFAAGTKFPGGVTPTFTAAGKDLYAVWYDAESSFYVVGAVWKDYK